MDNNSPERLAITMETTFRKSGDSIYLSLPVKLRKSMGIEHGTKAVIVCEKVNKKLTVFIEAETD